MRLVLVQDRSAEERFLRVPGLLGHVAHPDEAVREAFAAVEGHAARWILEDGVRPLGRVAAFHRSGPLGGAGWFECTDDPSAAAALLDAARDWLVARGAEGMDAPVHLGERDRFWGAMVRGQALPPIPYENHDPPHHVALLRGWGLRPRQETGSYRIPLATVPVDALRRIAERRGRRAPLLVEIVLGPALGRLLGDFLAVYAACFPPEGRLRPLEAGDLAGLLANPRAMAEVGVVFAWCDGEPAGFLAFHDRGPTLKAFAFAVHPAHRARGVDAALALGFFEELVRRGHDHALAIGIGAQTRRMLGLMDQLGGRLERVHQVLRRWFDDRPVDPLHLFTE